MLYSIISNPATELGRHEWPHIVNNKRGVMDKRFWIGIQHVDYEVLSSTAE